MIRIFGLYAVCGITLVTLLYGCAMSEEMRRIEEVKQVQQQREASFSTNLTGEQLFIRSCNSCHPGGKAGLGPNLDQLEAHFSNEDDLKKFIRAGKGNMPAFISSVVNDQELDGLVKYLRTFSRENP